jgi:hypothetical protein
LSEIYTLTTPLTKPSVLTFVIVFLSLDWGNSRIVVRIQWSDNTGEEFTYEGAEAVSLMTGLNSANLTTKSLYKRVGERLRDDGKVPPGSVTGTPA